MPPLHVHSSPRFRQCIVHALIKEMSQCFTPRSGPYLTGRRHDRSIARIFLVYEVHVTTNDFLYLQFRGFKAKYKLSTISDMVNQAAPR